MEQPNNKSLSNLDRIKAYSLYCKKYESYNNSFEKMNIGENSISQLYAWLLDTAWINETKYNIAENQIHRDFCYEFFKLIKANEIKNNRSVLQTLNDEQLKELAYEITAYQDTNNIDILLVNEKKKFVCVIENKKRAKLSNSRIENKNGRILQIEKYYNFINKSYKDYDKKFVYLCAEIQDVEKNISEKLIDVGTVPNYIKDNLKFQGLEYKEFCNKTVIWALEKLKYTVLEHSNVVLILYNILRGKYNYAFDKNGILKPITENEMLKIAEILFELSAHKNNQIITGRTKIRFYDGLSKICGYKECLKLLCQYVEYWELHDGTKYLSDNLLGYTKIVDGKYIYNVCEEIKQNQDEWQKVLKMAEKLPQIQEIIKYIQ